MYRVLGYTEQFEEDAYWVLLTKEEGKGPSLLLYSCVGSFINLKEYLPNAVYQEIEESWNLNGLSVEDGLNLVQQQSILLK